MRNILSGVELGALAYVAENRVREAQDIRALAGDGPLSDAAERYLLSVVALFMAIRERDAEASSSVQECHGRIRLV